MTTNADIASKLASFSYEEMMKNVDNVGGIARRMRLGQSAGSLGDELTLCRIMLDLKFMTELVDALTKHNKKLDADIASLNATMESMRLNYERMLGERKQEIDKLKNVNNGNIQPPKTGS